MNQSTLTRPTLFLMAFATGISVANLYYCQPLLDEMRKSLDVSVAHIGWIPTLSQSGYALGMLFIVPLGDMLERKKMVCIFTILSALSLAWIALSPSFISVAIASLVLGLTTMAPQLLIPFAAHLAEPTQRGKVVGFMLSGLLLGILLARTVSGFIGATYGWRFMYGLASTTLFFLSLLLFIKLPKSDPTFKGSYVNLLKSVVQIFKEQPVLREAAFFGAMLFGSFSVFWATLIHLMETPDFNLGARTVGLFGLLGAAAALVTPWLGSFTDRNGARKTTGLMIVVTILSFILFNLSATSLIGLSIGVIIMDVGVQSGHLCNQSRIFALIPEARSRIQTAYMFCYFLGGALGSLIGTWSWSHYQWTGVCMTSVVMLSLALMKFKFSKIR